MIRRVSAPVPNRPATSVQPEPLAATAPMETGACLDPGFSDAAGEFLYRAGEGTDFAPSDDLAALAVEAIDHAVGLSLEGDAGFLSGQDLGDEF